MSKHDVLKHFPERIKRGEDIDVWVRLSVMTDLCFINTRLKNYYEVPGDTSYSFDYSVTFEYSKLYFSETNAITDYFYLILCAVKKHFQVVTKAFRLKR